MTGYQQLANAIIVQAAKDYTQTLKRIKANPNDSKSITTKAEIENFFRSEWYKVLTSYDSDRLIRQLQSRK